MKKLGLLLGIVLPLALAALAWWQGWFASEPVYHGRTVTQWLDAMALFDDVRNVDVTRQRSFDLPTRPRRPAKLFWPWVQRPCRH